MYDTDLVQHLITAGQDLDAPDRDVSDVWNVVPLTANVKVMIVWVQL